MLRDNFSFGVLIFYLILVFISYATGIGWLTSLAVILSVIALLIYAYVKRKKGITIFIFIILIFYVLYLLMK